MKTKTISAWLAAAMFVSLPVLAAEATPADAIAMVDKGVAFMQKNGKDALLKAVNEKRAEFVHDGVYLMVRGLDGTQLAHPINPKLIGKNLVVLPDADGKYFRKEIIEQAQSKGTGWVDYRYNNPATGMIEKKSTYFRKNGNVILEAGIYKGR